MTFNVVRSQVNDHPARIVEPILQALVLHQLVVLPVQSCGFHRILPAHLEWGSAAPYSSRHTAPGTAHGSSSTRAAALRWGEVGATSSAG